MTLQFSQDYRVDSRHANVKGAIDNTAAPRFLNNYIKKRRQPVNSPLDRYQEDRFIMSGPGDSTYSFHNAFRASK